MNRYLHNKKLEEKFNKALLNLFEKEDNFEALYYIRTDTGEISFEEVDVYDLSEEKFKSIFGINPPEGYEGMFKMEENDRKLHIQFYYGEISLFFDLERVNIKNEDLLTIYGCIVYY